MSLGVSSYVGEAILPYIPELARLRIAVFAEWPYLYDGSFAYEETYLRTYAESPESVIVICRDGDRVVGASTAIPLRAEDEALQAPFAKAGLDPAKVFYLGESVLLPEYRGRGIGVRFFEEREKHARSFSWCEDLCFCAVVRSAQHPRRPASYAPLDDFWGKRGFRPLAGVYISITWKDHDEPRATPKQLQVWHKTLERR